ncbi:MAG: Mur ligase family protein, partial [bacterium]|nr:Mur ligase family protein [bacterium]
MKDIIRKFIPPVLLDFYHFSLAFIGALIYGFPSRKLKVIGVTGTNGKTTVVEMCRQVLDEAGFKVASLSSVKFKIKDREWPNTLKMTMPGRFKIQKFLRQAEDASCEYTVLEVTSEGIRQHRHRFIDFDTAVFTNITPEHVERHGSFEKYREAKGKLFQACKNIHIINLDDKNAEYFLQFPASKKINYRVRGGQIEWSPT